ncbi:hypothetical protein JCM11641_002068 [Rhodosporidiobolus odoratus]
MTASPPPPRFIFSHATDSSLPPELTSTEYPICTPSAGLGAPRERSRYDGDDNDVPAYGPTTHRRGPMRFVRASDGGLGVLAASRDEADGTDQAVDRNREGEAVKEEEDDDVIIVEPPQPAPKEKASGGTVRGLYESIVGLGTPLRTSTMTRDPLITAHIPGTSRSSGLASSQSSYALFRQPSSMPPSPPHRIKHEYYDGVIVISPSPPPARRRMRRPSPPIPVDAELLILNAHSCLPVSARPASAPVVLSAADLPSAPRLPLRRKRTRPANPPAGPNAKTTRPVLSRALHHGSTLTSS